MAETDLTLRTRVEGTGDAKAKLQKVTTGLIALGAAAGALGGAALNAFASFDKAANKLNNLLTPAERAAGALDGIKEKAIEVGAQLPLMNADILDGAVEFKKLGFNAEETRVALEGLGFATVANDLDSMTVAVEIGGAALNQFNLDADQTNHVMDVLTVGATSSATSFEGMGEALGFAGTQMASAGQTIEETTKILGLMANANLKGSKAGRNLATAVVTMTKNMDEATGKLEGTNVALVDSEGNFRDLSDVIFDLKDDMADLSESEKTLKVNALAGAEGGRALMAVMTNTKEAAEELEQAIAEADGTVQEFAEGMREGASGALQDFNAAIDTFMVTLGGAIGEVIEPFIRKLTEVALWVGENQAIMNILVGIIGGALIAGLIAVTAAFFVLIGPIGLAVIAIGGLIGIAASLAGGFQNLWDQAVMVWNGIRINILENIAGILGAIGKIIPGFSGMADGLISEAERLKDENERIYDEMNDRTEKQFREQKENSVKQITAMADQISETEGELKKDLEKQLDEMVATHKTKFGEIKVQTTEEMEAAKEASKKVVEEWVAEWAPGWEDVKDSAITIMEDLRDGSESLANEAMELITGEIKEEKPKIEGEFQDISNGMLAEGAEMLGQYISGIESQKPELNATLGGIISQVHNAIGFSFNPNLPMVQWGDEAITQWATGATQATPKIEVALEGARTVVKDFSTDSKNEIGSITTALEGYGTQVDTLADKQKEFAEDGVDSIKKLSAEYDAEVSNIQATLQGLAQDLEGIFSEFGDKEAENREKLAEAIVENEENIRDLKTQILEEDDEFRQAKLSAELEAEIAARENNVALIGKLEKEVTEIKRFNNLTRLGQAVETFEAEQQANTKWLQERLLAYDDELKKAEASIGEIEGLRSDLNSLVIQFMDEEIAKNGDLDAALKESLDDVGKLITQLEQLRELQNEMGAGGFGGARADGGAVTPGRSFLVGERGQELFVPSEPGVIIPNNALSSGAGGLTVVNQISGVFGSDAAEELGDMITDKVLMSVAV